MPRAATMEFLEIRRLLSDASTWLVIPAGADATWNDAAQVLTINAGTITICGNLASDAPPGSTGGSQVTQAVYGAPVMLAKGTFTGIAPTFTSENTAVGNVFVGNTGYATQASNIIFTTQIVSSITATPQAASLTQGGNSTVVLATFTDAVNTTDPTRYTASIDWFGDATEVTTGVVTSDGSGGFIVTGNVSFALPGILYPAVTITDTTNGSGVTVRASAPPVTSSIDQPAPINLTATLLYTFGGALGIDEYGATFDGPNGPGSGWSSDFDDQGDESCFAYFTVTRTDDPYDVLPVTADDWGDGEWIMWNGHFEGQPGTFDFTDAPGAQLAMTVAHGTGQNNEPGPVDSPPSNPYLITLPGTPWEPLTLTAVPSADGSGNVTLSWTGQQEPTDNVEIFLANAGPAAPGGATLVGNASAGVGQIEVRPGNTGQSFFAVDEEIDDGTPGEYLILQRAGPYSNFVRADGSTAPMVTTSGSASALQGGNYTLNLSAAYPTGVGSIQTWTIDWGDGSTGAPDVQTCDGSSASVTHVFAPGVTAATVSVTATDANATYSAVPITVNIPQTLTADAGLAPEAMAGQPFTGVVADFTDSTADATSQTYAASIKWGDGSTNSPADGTTVTVTPDGKGGFEVLGNHTYADSATGDQDATVTIHASDGRTIAVQTQVELPVPVADAMPIETAVSGSFPGYTPDQIKTYYGLMNQAGKPLTFNDGTTADGNGTTIAIVVLGNDSTLISDLTQFDDTFFPGAPRGNETGTDLVYRFGKF